MTGINQLEMRVHKVADRVGSTEQKVKLLTDLVDVLMKRIDENQTTIDMLKDRLND